ncbi:uncharacterized protein LOC131062829 [Cryptomeria japonica]|uniref:uncharacterized protein LOC131062829 n=1 Tax=Cryptomeria japonica TaxID=3369 RepID=UPI0025ACFA74|nr:uncharacterized protein LOC131062829 [Cryptomeria japonica]
MFLTRLKNLVMATHCIFASRSIILTSLSSQTHCYKTLHQSFPRALGLLRTSKNERNCLSFSKRKMANRLRRSDSKVGAVCAIQQNAISLPALGSGTAVLQSSLKVSVNLIAICIFVAWLQKTGQLPADTPRVLSQVSFRLIIPCFLMSKVSRTLAFQHQGNILIIPFIGIIEIFVGAMLGKAAIRFIRKDTYLKRVNASNDPSSIEDLTAEDIKLAKNDALVIAACAFGNTVTLPLVILSGILSPKDASMANAFVALVMIGWSPFLWSYGYQMFNTAFAENTPSYVDTKISFLQICTIWFKRITNPPLYGALLGILIGGTPLAHFFFPIKGTLPGIFRKVDGSFTALYMGCSGLLQTIWERLSKLWRRLNNGSLKVFRKDKDRSFRFFHVQDHIEFVIVQIGVSFISLLYQFVRVWLWVCEDIAFRKSKSTRELEDQESSLNMEEDLAPEIQRETHEVIENEGQNEFMDPANEPRDTNVNRKRPLWARKMIQEAKDYVAPQGTLRESKRPHRFSSYVDLKSEIIKSEPSNVKEAFKNQVWKDAMTEDLEVWQQANSIILNQGKYTIDILKRFGMECKPMSTPMETNLHKLKEAAAESEFANPTLYRQIIGSLMYLVNTRPDICYPINALSQFMCEPKQIHMVAAKHILRYLRGTIGYGLKYTNVDLDLHGYTDSDWARSVVDRKSTSRCCFSLGSAVISWISRKQSSVAQSSTEAEYIAASMGAKEAVWLRKLLVGLFGQPLDSTIIHCDNQSCIKISVNLGFHDRSKHIEIPYHYVRDMVERKVIQLKYVSTGEQTTNILTKPLSKSKVEHFRDKLGMVENVS